MGSKQTTLQQKLHIIERLREVLVQTDEIVSDGTRLWRYLDDLNDKRVAKEFGISSNHIAYLRMQLFGKTQRPKGDPNAKKAYPDKKAANLNQMFNDLKDDIRMHDTHLKALDTMLGRVQDRLDFLARELGVTWPTRSEV